MAAHSTILAWRIPWTEGPGRIQFMGSQKVGRDLVTENGHGWMAVSLFATVIIFFNLFFVVLGLRFYVWAFSCCSEQSYSLLQCAGFSLQ